MSLKETRYQKFLVLHSGVSRAEGKNFPKITVLDSYHGQGESDSEYREQHGWIPRQMNCSLALCRAVMSSELPSVWNLNVKTEKVNTDNSAKSVVVDGEYLEKAFIGDFEDVQSELKPILQQMQASQQSQGDHSAQLSSQSSSSNRRQTAQTSSNRERSTSAAS